MTQISKLNNIVNSYAHCLLIRFASRAMRDERAGEQRAFIDYLESCLRYVI
jgi:hypothetical protein